MKIEDRKLREIDRDIKKAKELLEQTAADDPGRADSLRQLAAHYKRGFDRLVELGDVLDEEIREAITKFEKDRLRRQREMVPKAAKTYREGYIRNNVEIYNNFPEYEDFDAVLYDIGHELYLMVPKDGLCDSGHYLELSRNFLRRLLEDFPHSEFVPLVYLNWGTYYFDHARNCERAMRALDKVIEWGETNNDGYLGAIHYQGLCLAHEDKYEGAVDKHIEVLKRAASKPDDTTAQEVAERSRTEIVKLVSRKGKPKLAWNYFQEIAGEHAHEMLKMLAYLYFERDSWTEALLIFEQLLKLESENYLGNQGADLAEYERMIRRAQELLEKKNDLRR